MCEQVLIAIRRIIRAVDLHSRLLLQHHGLTGPQLVILKSLAETGEVSVGQLAHSVHLSQGTVTGILDRLESRQLVTRRRGTTDKRQMLAQPTEYALTLVRDAPSPLQDRFIDEFGRLADWEKSQILSVLQRVVAMMEAESVDGTPILTTGAIEDSITEAGKNVQNDPGQSHRSDS